MHSYHVVDDMAGQRHITLRDPNGRFHLARYLHHPPLVGATLRGARPHLGFGLLLCGSSDKIFRVIFERIDKADFASLSDAA